VDISEAGCDAGCCVQNFHVPGKSMMGILQRPEHHPFKKARDDTHHSQYSVPSLAVKNYSRASQKDVAWKRLPTRTFQLG